MKIYTRSGDKGTTGLVGGERVSKSDARLSAYGTLDELNAFLGEAVGRVQLAANSAPHLPRLDAVLQKIQSDLLSIGSHLASTAPDMQKNLPPLPVERIAEMEQEIDWMTAQIPPLRQFIIPGGTECSRQLHICRTICRRAERETVALAQVAAIEKPIIEYLNRLSDYLFTSARFAQHMQGQHDVLWNPSL
jgi:cob(I)alamin adenosyltransferase